jgi:hypothetical protein
MIQIVHWKDYVPGMFMDKFMDIEIALATAKRFDRVNEVEESIMKKDKDAYEQWKNIRWKMAHSGYERLDAGNQVFWKERGWPGTAIVERKNGMEEIFFRYVADSPEKPLYISIAQLMALKTELGQLSVEDENYSPDRYTKALSRKMNVNPKKRYDKDFPEEES